MDKNKVTKACGLVLLAIVVFFMIPGIKSLAKGKSDFEIQGTILKAYTGDDERVTIPDRVTEIGPQAFEGSKLTDITIPGTVTKIHTQAFYNCKNLNRVVISEGVEKIGMSAFASCHRLNMVSIPSTVNVIEPGAFADCQSLSYLQFSPYNTSFFFDDGVLYDRKSEELIQYLAGRRATTFQIPFTVHKIDRFAFWGASLLRDVQIISAIKEIPEHAFSNCIGLTQIELPSKLERIGNYAFSDCENLSLVVFNSKPEIEKTAFDRCNKRLLRDLSNENPVFRVNDEEDKEDIKQESDKKPEQVSAYDGTQVVSPENGKEKKKEKIAQDTWYDDDIQGKVKRKNGSYSKVFYPKDISNEPIKDTEDTIGYSKVSGGRVLVIPKTSK